MGANQGSLLVPCRQTSDAIASTQRGGAMKTFDVRAYAISDFIEWHESKKLVLSPEFQRRDVWSVTAKAFLADTILRGKPFPKIILMQDFVDGRTVRIVVDGQQRLRAILDFYGDGIKISRAHNPEHAGKTFSQLPQELRDEFLQYQIGCDVLYSAPLSELLDIFARINRYTVKLNAQEIRNAQYSGYFKTTAFRIGYENVDAWLEAKILTKSGVSRMAEAEFASDLLATFLNQIQSSKAIEASYRKYEDVEDGVQEAASRLRNALATVYSIYSPEELVGTAWSSQHMFYTLVTVVGHLVQPFANLDPTDLDPSVLSETEKLASILNGVSSDYLNYSPQPKRSLAPDRAKDFIRASTLATTDAAARVIRANYILKQVEAYF